MKTFTITLASSPEELRAVGKSFGLTGKAYRNFIEAVFSAKVTIEIPADGYAKVTRIEGFTYRPSVDAANNDPQ